MTRLALAMIVKDAATTIEACLDSVLPFVDEVVIGYGGKSSDDTEEIVEAIRERYRAEYPDRIFETFPIQWEDDFAAARNLVWKRIAHRQPGMHLDDPADWAMWLDADDVLLNGEKIRAAIERAEEEGANCISLPYHYDEDEFGNLTCTLARERIVRPPEAWHWGGAIGAVHENLVLDESIPFIPMYVEDIVVRHQPNRPREHKRNRNLDILDRELAKSEPNPSQALLFYLGRENAVRGNLKEAFNHFNRYISRAERSDEAYQVAVMLSDVCRAAGRWDEAVHYAVRATKFQPQWPDALMMLARIAFDQQDWLSAIEWIKAASTKEVPVTGLIVDPKQYNFWPYYYLGFAQARLGHLDEAIENLRRAATVAPDENLLAAMREIENARTEQGVYQHFKGLYEHLGKNSEWMKARALFTVAPTAIKGSPEVQELWRRTDLMTRHIVDPAAMAEFYGSNPGWYATPEELVLTDGEGTGYKPRLDFAKKALCEPPKYVLDVGCADGMISLPLARAGYKVLGIDMDPHPAALAQERAEKWGIADHATFRQGTIDDMFQLMLNDELPEPVDRFDAVIAFEIIEHLPDVKGFLDKLDRLGNKVILTTPYLDWENGRWPEWDKLEPKGHIRIFDLDDIEIELAPRGQIVDLYREPFGPSSWIFASYYPGRQSKGSVTFLAPGTLESFGSRKLREEGLGGSETALIRLAEELAATGMSVTVYGNIDSPGYYSGVRYREWESFIPGVKQDTVVAWRLPEAADMGINTKNLVLWMHDTDAGDRFTEQRADKFKTVVTLSDWHQSHFLQTYPFALNTVWVPIIGNGVDAGRFKKAEDDLIDLEGDFSFTRYPKRVIYTSSPDRGLDTILEHIWPKVVAAVPDAELHVYYGWGNFDRLARAGRADLREFKQRVANLVLDTKGVVFHGRVNQDELAREMLKASVWLYPTRFSETYCITAVEMQQAGVVPVTTDLAALAETVKAGVIIPSHGPDGRMIDVKDQAQEYADAVIDLLQNPLVANNHRADARANAPKLTWEDVAIRWRTQVLEP